MDEFNFSQEAEAEVFRHLVAKSTNAVVVHDEHRIYYLNPYAEHLLSALANHPGERQLDVMLRLMGVAGGRDSAVIVNHPDNHSYSVRINGFCIRWHDRQVHCHELMDLSGPVAAMVEQHLMRSVELCAAVEAAVAGALTQADALEQALTVVVERMDCPLGELWVPQQGNHTLYLRAVRSSPDGASLSRASEHVRIDELLWMRLIEDAQIVWFDASSEDPSSPLFPTDRANAAGITAACVVPVKLNGEVVAVMMYCARRVHAHSTHMVNSLLAALAPLADCIARLQLQSELNTTDQRLSLILQHATSGTFEWDPQTDRIKWDRGFNRIAGFPEYTRGGSLQELINLVHHDDRGFCHTAIEAARRSPDGLYMKLRFIRPNGEVRRVMVRGVAALDKAGIGQRIVGACWDETDALNTATHMASLAQFHEENPQPVFRVLADNSLAEQNSAGRAVLAAWEQRSELSDDFLALLDSVRSDGTSCVRDISIGDRVYQMNVIAVPGQDYVNVYATEVTELRRSERAMQQASKMEAIGLLAGGVAHDFNNRLTVILGNLELLEMELESNDEVAGLLRDARHAAEQSSNLAGQLLAISRPPASRASLTDVNQLIDRLGSILDRCIGETRLLRLELNAADSSIMIEPSGFEDLLVNLTINARDAMRDGDSLTIETTNIDQSGLRQAGRTDLSSESYLRVVVRDTGRGMPADVREHAFEPFFTTKAEKGTGLGLSMVYSFVTQAAGHISIDSEEDRGTSVEILLPIAGENPTPEAASQYLQ